MFKNKFDFKILTMFIMASTTTTKPVGGHKMENKKTSNLAEVMASMDSLETKIKSLGEARTLKLSEELDSMILEYTKLHNEVTELLNTNEGIRWDKLDMIRRLSQYGLGLHKLGKAYSALNPVRCN